MVAALTRIFGVHNLALAEDVVQDAFCRALEVWKFRGVPENPVGVADGDGQEPRDRRAAARAHGAHVRAGARASARERVDARADGRGALRSARREGRPAADDVFVLPSATAPKKRRSRSCCTSCAASASARSPRRFSSTEAAIQKRISRAKKVLAGSKRLFDLADADFPRRLSAVHRALVSAVQRGLPRRLRRIGGAGGTVPRGDPPDRSAARTPAHSDAGDVRAGRADVAARGAPADAGERGRTAASSARSGSIALGRDADRRRSAICSSSRRPVRS